MNTMMKTLTLSLLLSGVALIAPKTPSQAAEPSKFQQLKTQYESGKVKMVPKSPDVKDFLDTSNTEIQSLQNQLRALLKEKGYLVGTDYEHVAQNFLSDSKKNIASLREIQNLPSEIALARAQVPLLIELLKNMPIPDKFPFKCYDYKGKSVEGIVDRYLGALVFRYGAADADFHKFIQPNEDVGLIGSGKENLPSVTSEGKQQTALLGPDGTVACLSLEHAPKVSAPSLKPSKK